MASEAIQGFARSALWCAAELVWPITISDYNLTPSHVPEPVFRKGHAQKDIVRREERMAKVAAARAARSVVVEEGAATPLDLGELSELLGYALKRAQLK